MKKIFYGWFNVIACIAVMLAILGIGSATFSLYIKPVSEDLGVSRSSVSFIISVSTLLGAFASMNYGKIVKKMGLKKMMIIGGFAYALRMASYSFSNSIVGFYMITAVGGFFTVFVTTIPISAIIQNWFVSRRGLILGIVFSASGVGGMVFNPVIGRLITDYGWRTSFRVEAVLMLVLLVPAFLLISVHPREKGAMALGAQAGKSEVKKAGVTGLTLQEAKKTARFKLLAVALACYTIGIQSLMYTVPGYVSDSGFDLAFAASIMSTIFIVNAISKIVLGMVNDRFGLKSVLAVGFAAFLIADVLLIFSQSSVMLLGFGMFYGISITMMTVPLPLLITKLFGQKDYSSIMGVMMSVLSVSWAVGVPLCSASYDWLGTYVPAYIGEAGLVVVAWIVIIKAFSLSEAQALPTSDVDEAVGL